MKYKLTHNTQIINGVTLYQIQALKDFSDVKTGDLGGWIERESNLSQDDDCWVSGDAWVFGNARIFGSAWVYGSAWVSGNARVYGNAQVSGSAWVSGNARVYGNAVVHGYARVFGDARVSGSVKVCGNARVFGNARVYGDAWVYGDAKIAQTQNIKFNHVINDITDIASNLLENIEAQTGLVSINNEIYCYKHVDSDLSSLHDPNFKYTVGEYTSVDNFNTDQTSSCSSGLHVSNAQYWNDHSGKIRLFCRVHVDDILAVQQGKIRCKRLFVIGVCDGLVF